MQNRKQLKDNIDRREFEEQIVSDVRADFESRREARRSFELAWRLNINYLAGNQYCFISPRGEIEDNDRSYFWQQREVYNHLSPILESRLSKLARVRPKMAVLPVSGDEGDIYAAKASTNILNAAFFRLGIDDLISEATMWSEATGTSFYKVVWDFQGGRQMPALAQAQSARRRNPSHCASSGEDFQGGRQMRPPQVGTNVDRKSPNCASKPHQSGEGKLTEAELAEQYDTFVAGAYEGDVRIDVCPPFEIYPSDNFAQSIDAQSSIIHAKAYPVSVIKNMYGADVDAEDVETSFIDTRMLGGGLGYSAGIQKHGAKRRDGYAMVLERYERPTDKYPEGRLIVVAGGKLVHYGCLPFLSGINGERNLPFIRQICLEQPGVFWGSSVVERAIPIQRAYNAVKNRKHEFLNRVSVGVLAVEDGSVDTENLEEEGLSPGKILVYRQGSTPPRPLNPDRVPPEFNYEEDRLLSEFITITGVSEIMRNSGVPNSVTSGVALQMLIEQDDTRLSLTAELIRKAVKYIGQHIIRLYKQFASELRCSRILGAEGAVELMYWKAGDISSDELAFVTENELNTTPAGKRSMIFDLLRTGLLNDSDGGMTSATKAKVLDLLGLGIWEDAYDLSALQRKRAVKENLELLDGEVQIKPYDDHDVHIAEHTRCLLSDEWSGEEAEARLVQHLKQHEQMLGQANDG